MWHLIQCLPGYMPQSFVAMVSRVLQDCLMWRMIQCLPGYVPQSFVAMVSRVLCAGVSPPWLMLHSFGAKFFQSVVGLLDVVRDSVSVGTCFTHLLPCVFGVLCDGVSPWPHALVICCRVF